MRASAVMRLSISLSRRSGPGAACPGRRRRCKQQPCRRRSKPATRERRASAHRPRWQQPYGLSEPATAPPGHTGRHADRKAGGAARTRTGDGGFADLCLATWRRRRQDGCAGGARRRPLAVTRQVQPFERGVALTDLADGRWSGKRDSNPRLRPWQGRTLPLSYSRSPRTLRQRYHRERLRFKTLARPAARRRRNGDRLVYLHRVDDTLAKPAARRRANGAAATGSGPGVAGRVVPADAPRQRRGSDRLRTRPPRQGRNGAAGGRRRVDEVALIAAAAARTQRRSRRQAQHGRQPPVTVSDRASRPRTRSEST